MADEPTTEELARIIESFDEQVVGPPCKKSAQRLRYLQQTVDALPLRPSVLVFACEMEKRLHEHSGKKCNQNGANGVRGWRSDWVDDLIERTEEEMQEVKDAMAAQGDDAAADEAIDLANMAMMVWDNLSRRDDATDPDDWDTRESAERARGGEG